MSDPPIPEDVPDDIKLWRWIVRHVHQEKDMVRKAPFALLIVFGLGCFISYKIASWVYSERIENAEARVKLAQDRLDGYKDNAHNTSIDKATEQIKDRHLSASAIRSLQQCIGVHKKDLE